MNFDRFARGRSFAEEVEYHPRAVVGFVQTPPSRLRIRKDLNNPPTSESVKKLLDQNITQVTEIRRLGRGQSRGSRCDKFNAPPPQVSEASSSNQPFNAVKGRGSSDTLGPDIQS